VRVAARVLLVATLAFLAGALLLPRRLRVERSRTLDASPARLYPLLADLRGGWPRWSPFGKAHDPELVETFSGPQSGAGATESWTGGSTPPGSLVLTRANPASGVEFRLEMQNGTRIEGRIAISPAPPGTRVTWTDEVELGRSFTSGWLGLMLRPMLGSSIDGALQALERAAR